MTTFDQAVRAVQQHGAQFQPTLRSWVAYLGDGAGNVVSDTAKNRYFCRYPADDSPSSEVYAAGCPPVDGMRVMVGYSADQPKLVRILSWTDPALENTIFPLQRHGGTHSYLQGDTTWIDWRQILTLKVQPYSGLIVYVNGGVLPRSGVDLYVLPQIVDMSGSVPNTIGEGRYALLSLDPNGDVVITNGTPITPGTALDISNIPDTPSGNFRLAAVQLVYGQTTIEETTSRRDIQDLRWPQETIAGSLAPGSIGGATAQYQYLVSGAGPTYTAQWSNGYLAITSGKTLTAQNNLTLSGTDGKALTLTGSLTIGADTSLTGGGTIGLGGYTLTVPATGTAALLDRIGGQTFTTVQNFNAQVNLYSDNQISSSASDGVWLSTGQGSFSGHPDDLMFTGFNVTGAGAVRTPGQISWHLGMERDYWASGTVHQAEGYFQAVTTAGVPIRVFAFTYRWNDNAGMLDFRGQSTFSKTDNSSYILQVIPDGASPGISVTGVPIRHETNSVNFLMQKNAAGSAYVSLLFLHSSNNVIIGQTGYPVCVDSSIIFSTGDTVANLYRSGYGIIKTDGQFVAAGFITAGNRVYLSATELLVGSGGVMQAYANTRYDTYIGGSAIQQIFSNSVVFYQPTTFSIADAVTNNITVLETLDHNSTGTPTTGFGSRVLYRLKTSTTANTDAAQLDITWSDVAHATRKGRVALSIYDTTTAREAWRSISNGSDALTSFGLGSDPAAFIHVAPSTIGAASLRIPAGTAPTAPAEGDKWNDSTQKADIAFLAGVSQARVGCIYSSYADVTVIGTASETTLLGGSAKGTLTLPANFWTVGKKIRIRGGGIHSMPGGSPTMQIRLYLGSVLIGDTTALVDKNDTNTAHSFDYQVTCITTGATGTVKCTGFMLHHEGTVDVNMWPFENTGTATVDTTAIMAVNLTVQFSTGTGTSITASNMTIEVLE